MRKYYLMRHAHAEDGDPMDGSRHITDKGVKQCKAIRKFLDDLGVKFDAVFSSDFKRAIETAEELGDDPIELIQLRPNSTPENAWSQLIDELTVDEQERFGDNDQHILIVTHDPLIQPVLAAVQFQFSAEHNLFDHANMARFDSDGTFHWFVTPKIAKKLVESGMASQLKDAVTEFGAEVTKLAEAVSFSSRRRALAPIEAYLKQAVKKRFRGLSSDAFAAHYEAATKKAQQAGARAAMAMLGPVVKESHLPVAEVVEVEYRDSPFGRGLYAKVKPIEAKRPPMVLPDPKRTAEMAEKEIDWTDLDHSSKRALMIAKYEVSKAYFDGMKAFAGLWRGGNGPVEKQWELNGEGCEAICQPNAEMNYIDEEAPFDSGDFEPPAHPNCDCGLSFRQVPE